MSFSCMVLSHPCMISNFLNVSTILLKCIITFIYNIYLNCTDCVYICRFCVWGFSYLSIQCGFASNGPQEFVQCPAIDCRSLSNVQQWTVGDYPKLSNRLQGLSKVQQWTVGSLFVSSNGLYEIIQSPAMDCRRLSNDQQWTV